MDSFSCRRRRVHHLRRAGHDQILFRKLAVYPAPPGKVDRHPEAGEHIKAVVKRPILRPLVRNPERGARVPAPPELREVRPAQRVPVAVAVRVADVLRQQLQRPHIVGVGLHQVNVVLDGRLDKGVICRVFARIEPPVHKQPLHPVMPHAAGVARQIEPLRNLVDTAKASAHAAKFLLCKLRRLFHKDPVVFLTLVLARDCRAVARHVAELDGRAVEKVDDVQRCVVGRQALRQHRQHRLDDGVAQILIFSPDEQNLDAGVLQRPAQALAHRAPCFAAASCAAERGILRPRRKKPLLRLRIWPTQIDL